MRTYSVTAITAGRRSLFQVAATAELFIDTIQTYRLKQKFELYGFVVMPDHVHLLLTPAPDTPLEKTVQLIKGGFSFRLKHKPEVWERGYYDRRILDETAFDTCRQYIEQNPVRARLAAAPQEYAYTSATRPGMLDPKPAWFPGDNQG
jgi:putative transposase